MPIHIDDLSVGRWVTVTARKYDPECGHQCPMDCNGLPLKIKAISLPFVATEAHDGAIVPIDTPRFELTLAQADYVKAMEGYLDEDEPFDNPFDEGQQPVERGGLACPLCGSRLHERLANRTWVLACDCGFEGRSQV